MSTICTTVRDLIELLETLDPDTPINEEQTRVVLMNTVECSYTGETERVELYFEDPDAGE